MLTRGEFAQGQMFFKGIKNSRGAEQMPEMKRAY